MSAQQEEQAAQIRAVVEAWAQAVRDHDLGGILALALSLDELIPSASS
jgi:ketosteroid isomerase-like protein